MMILIVVVILMPIILIMMMMMILRMTIIFYYYYHYNYPQAYNVRLQEYNVLDIQFLHGIGISKTNSSNTSNATASGSSKKVMKGSTATTANTSDSDGGSMYYSTGSTSRCLVAILSQDLKEKRHVKVYSADLSTKELNFDAPLCDVSDVDPGSNILIPLEPPLCGVLGKR